MADVYIGIDNGVSGSIGIIGSNFYKMYHTPIIKEQSYTKAKNNISRINRKELIDILKPYQADSVLVILERPLVNPTRFKASISAVRALEATLNIIEDLNYPHQYIDSKEWQTRKNGLLPHDMKGSPELKKASKDIAMRLFPNCIEIIQKQKDGDGLLIAEYCKRQQF